MQIKISNLLELFKSFTKKVYIHLRNLTYLDLLRLVSVFLFLYYIPKFIGSAILEYLCYPWVHGHFYSLISRLVGFTLFGLVYFILSYISPKYCKLIKNLIKKYFQGYLKSPLKMIKAGVAGETLSWLLLAILTCVIGTTKAVFCIEASQQVFGGDSGGESDNPVEVRIKAARIIAFERAKYVARETYTSADMAELDALAVKIKVDLPQNLVGAITQYQRGEFIHFGYKQATIDCEQIYHKLGLQARVELSDIIGLSVELSDIIGLSPDDRSGSPRAIQAQNKLHSLLHMGPVKLMTNEQAAIIRVEFNELFGLKPDYDSDSEDGNDSVDGSGYDGCSENESGYGYSESESENQSKKRKAELFR